MSKKQLKEENGILIEALIERDFELKLVRKHIDIAESEINRLNVIINYLETKDLK